ncbi:MAG: alpha/beta fold hydrolase [Gammaproteobacteria bacterium]|nr:alpha/beta fold hydrolase [Gammaproteobacteria bacterium]
MMLFIHGLGSCGWGEKSLLLRRHFGIERVIAPNLPFDPAEAIAFLVELIERYPVRCLVGSSLGGFFATCLNHEHRLPSVLINPVVRPHALLQDHLGPQTRWCDERPFDIDPGYLATLQHQHRATIAGDEHYLVLLQQGDEVLDYREAAAYYATEDIVSQPGGDHRFVGLVDHLPTIEHWLRQHDAHPAA